MAPSSITQADYYGQTIENCSFISHEDADISIVTSKDPASGKFRATVIRTEGYGRKKKRTALVSEAGSTMLEAFKLLHNKSAEAVQTHVSTLGYGIVQKKNKSKKSKHKSKGWEEAAISSSDDSSSSSSGSDDDSDASGSTETISDDDTVDFSSKKHRRKKHAKSGDITPKGPAFPRIINPGPINPGIGPRPPGWTPFHPRFPPGGRGPPPPPPGVLHRRMPGFAAATDGSVGPPPPMPYPGPMPPVPTLSSPPAPPGTSAPTAPGGPAARLSMPFPPGMPVPPGFRPDQEFQPPSFPTRAEAAEQASAATKRDILLRIKWLGHGRSPTIFVRSTLSKQAIAEQAMHYVNMNRDQFGPPSPQQPQRMVLQCKIRDLVLQADPSQPGSIDQAFSVAAYENDDLSGLVNSICSNGGLLRFDVTVVGRPPLPRPRGPNVINVEPSPPPPLNGWHFAPSTASKPDPMYGSDGIVDDD